MMVMMRARESQGASAADFVFHAAGYHSPVQETEFAVCGLRFAASAGSQGAPKGPMVFSIFTTAFLTTKKKKKFYCCWDGIGWDRMGSSWGPGWDGMGYDLRIPWEGSVYETCV